MLSTITNVGGAEVTEFQHLDRLGTKLVTNNQANTSFEQSTLPFGTALNAESTGATNQRFTSYDRSSAANIDYAVNRSYSAGQGRFTSVDPIGMGATNLGDPQSMNMYAYVENNPIDFTDPSGLDDEGPPIIIDSPDWWRDLYQLWLHSQERVLIQPVISDPVEHIPSDNVITDCMTLVSEVIRIAKETKDRRVDFKEALLERFKRSVDKDPNTRPQKYKEFRSTGFKDDFTDEIPRTPGGSDNSPNQVYHYVGTFEAGFVAGDFLGNYLGYIL